MLNKLAIVILNYNSSELTINAVQNILKLELGAKIIIVDNCSTDNSREILKKSFMNEERVSLIYSLSNNGYAAGNNIGIHAVEKMNTDIEAILIMNPDIEISNRHVLVEMYHALMEKQEIGAITVKTIFNGRIREPNECAWHFMTSAYMMFGGTIIGKYFVKPHFFRKEESREPITYMDVVQGCFFMMRLKDLQEVNYLDEHTFLYTEEAILAKKLEKIGKKNAVLISYYINHNHYEKKRKMLKYSNKVFDMKCYYQSRKYYIREYSGKSKIFYIVASIILNLDYLIKKIYLCIRLS